MSLVTRVVQGADEVAASETEAVGETSAEEAEEGATVEEATMTDTEEWSYFVRSTKSLVDIGTSFHTLITSLLVLE